MTKRSGAVDGTDGMLWNDSEEDGHIRSECEEDEGTECEDGDSDACCVLSAIKSKIFFLADIIFWGGHVRFE